VGAVLRRWFRFGVRLAVVAGAAVAVRRLWDARRAPEVPGDGWAGADRSWTPPAPASAPGHTAPAAPPAQPPDAPTSHDGQGEPSGAAAPHEAPPPAAAPVPATPPAAPPAAAGNEADDAASAAPRDAAPTTPAGRSGAAAKAKSTKAPTRVTAGGAPRIWVEPVGTTCPPDHPVKVKLASRLFRVPGMFAYDRTRPDRCYGDEHEAIAEGFTRAQR